MNQSFDIYNQQEKPPMSLCNPNQEELFSLGASYNVNPSFRWNAISEISFDFPRYIDGVELPAFSYLEGKRLVLLEDIGYFVLNDPEEDNDGGTPIKHLTALSLESELITKNVLSLAGTYKMYDATDPTNLETIVGLISYYAPNWTVSEVDATLVDKYRTFSSSNTNLYSFLTSEANSAYNCFFIFDYLNREIRIVDYDTAINETDIFLSFDNLIKNEHYKEISSEIFTAMECNGGGGLTIRNVNPLGTNYIYNFTYYKTSEWMSEGLVTAITNWENKFSGYLSVYSGYAVSLSDHQTELVEEQAVLTDMQSQLAIYNQTLEIRTQQGLDTTEVEALIDEQEILINNQNLVIVGIQSSIASVTATMIAINQDLAFTNTANFTTVQYLELNAYIYEHTYKNENIIITDIMTNDEINQQSLDLYNDAQSVLARTSIPRYQITIDSINFLAIKEYLPFIEQFNLGDQITLDSGKGYYISSTLLEYSFSYDNPEEFSIIISNQKRLDNASFIFTDYMNETLRVSSDISSTRDAINDWSVNKPIIVSNVTTPSGISSYGIVADNIKGEIVANPLLNITNINSTTGLSNFSLSQDGVVLREPTIYTIDDGVGISRDIVTAGGGVVSFRNGIFISGSGLAEGSSVTILEDLTGQSGSYVSISGSYISNSPRVFINSVIQMKGFHYTESPQSGFDILDEIQVGDSVLVEYVPLIA